MVKVQLCKGNSYETEGNSRNPKKTNDLEFRIYMSKNIPIEFEQDMDGHLQGYK